MTVEIDLEFRSRPETSDQWLALDRAMENALESTPACDVRAAMEQLGWNVRDLYVATFAYGSVGGEQDLFLHLATGNHLGPPEVAILVAALNDALMDRGDTSLPSTT